MIPQHLKIFVILHCCWRQTDALFIAVFYAIYDEGTQEEKIHYSDTSANEENSFRNHIL